MVQKKKKSLDFKVDARGISNQFRGLDFSNPWQWPIWPQMALLFLIALGVVVLVWALLIRNQQEELQTEKEREETLRAEFVDKANKAANLDLLKKQREQVQQYVLQLEKQLPNKSEIDQLLSDVNQAGVSRGMQFDLFKPSNVIFHDYYAELPIAIKLSGQYHDIGSFVADVAALSRIVTINDINITPARVASGGKIANPNFLTMEATARTYRYLDEQEIKEQKAQKNAKGKK